MFKDSEGYSIYQPENYQVYEPDRSEYPPAPFPLMEPLPEPIADEDKI